jgi:kynurenine formamidase
MIAQASDMNVRMLLIQRQRPYVHVVFRRCPAGVGVCEHLTGLGARPGSGSRFTAVPPRVTGFGTFPVRARASRGYIS